MSNELTPVTHEKSTEMKWAEVVLFLTDASFLDNRKVSQWAEYFSTVTIAAKSQRPANLSDSITWYCYKEEQSRAEVWNVLADSSQKQWILFLVDDEIVRFGSLPEEHSIGSDKWPPVLIRHKKPGKDRQFYHMRMVNTSLSENGNIFAGKNLTDCTQFVRENEIELANQPVIVERKSCPIEHINIDEELSVKTNAPKLYLVQGERYIKEKKYVRAAAQYRQLLKKDKLLPFDRLAGVNGLASCLTEQHKWKKALVLAKESLKAESLQSLPYLIQFRIHELKKEWRKAHDILHQYYQRISLHSRANFDRKIEEGKTLVRLANVSLKDGNRKQAADYFDKLFSYKREEIDRSVLKKVLVLSIELENYERSVSLFERLLGKRLPDDLEQEHLEELDDYMTMFMQREWYEYVSNVYAKLHNAFPENRSYKRRLIVTLTKTNRLDKAKKMVANIV